MFGSEWITVLAFYTVIILLIAHFRKKFEFHGWIKFLGLKFPLVAQLKTKLGLGLMKKIGEGHPKAVNRIAYIGIYAGYLGMLVVLGFVIYGVYQLFADPTAPATFTPVIPGAKIPGSPIAFPFWHTIIALFVTVVIHEFSHGVVSRANKIPVQSSGYAQVGPFSAAFVEPDEKILQKAPKKVQNAIFAAGPWSNFLTAGLVMILLSLVFTPISENLIADSDLTFVSIDPEGPAGIAGLKENTTYVSLEGQEVLTGTYFLETLANKKPGDTVTFIDNAGESVEVELGEGPRPNILGFEYGEPRALLGVYGWYFDIEPSIPKFPYDAYKWFEELFVWIFILSVGLGMGNLIPAGPVDGGRMYLIACQKFFGDKKGEVIWSKTAVVLFFLIIALFIVPIIRAVIPF